MTYCQPEDVSRYITAIETADIAGAISAATDMVHNYTGDRFSTTAATQYAVTNRSGVAALNITARTVSGVALADSGETLPVDIWVFQAGRVPSVRLIANLPWNILINGREPWNQGRSLGNIRLAISGSFGYASCPDAVKEATAMLAAQYLAQTGQGTYTDAGSSIQGPEANVASISVEGYSVSYRDTSASVSSTGLSVVDRLLAPYRRTSGIRWS